MSFVTHFPFFLGSTLQVSSGDDGSPGFGFTCPLDPNWPIFGETCPLTPTEKGGGCGCATFVISKPMTSISPSEGGTSSIVTTTKSCIFPMGYFLGSMYPPETTAGADCDLLLQEADCLMAFNDFIYLNGSVYDNGSCTTVWSEGGMPYSSCKCQDTGVIAQVGQCSIQGYVYDSNTYPQTGKGIHLC